MITDTIAAIATAAGEGGIGIVRISGAEAVVVAEKIFVARNAVKIATALPRFAVLGTVVFENEILDEALAIKFVAPASYTGEDVVELQAHGGVVACRRILQAALNSGARLAEPGEFTKRAFLNGKIDLTQAEAVIDVIRAKTDAALRAANRNLGGKLSGQVEGLRGKILAMLAHIAVAVDYPEDDIEELLTVDVNAAVNQWQEELSRIIQTAASGRILRDGLRTTILGKPNAGKSSLMNELLGVERAIVTAIPGTTRDTIEEYLDFDGIPLVLVDTAGLRDTDDAVERIGVARAQAAAENADLIIYVIDGTATVTADDLSKIREYTGKTIVVVNKSDLGVIVDIENLTQAIGETPLIVMSAVAGKGVDELKVAVRNKVYCGGVEPEHITLANTRQLDVLQRALRSLQDTRAALADQMPVDVLSVDMRLAWETLGEITGDTADGGLLDRIFSEFCLGK